MAPATHPLRPTNWRPRRQVTHTYAAVTPATGTAVTYAISVDLVDGTTYSGVGSQSVSVDMTDATTTDLTASRHICVFRWDRDADGNRGRCGLDNGHPQRNARVGRVLRRHDRPGPGTFASGSFTLATPLLTVGTDSFTAVYSGNGTFDQSTSAAVDVSVSYPTLRGTALTLSGSADGN